MGFKNLDHHRISVREENHYKDLYGSSNFNQTILRSWNPKVEGFQTFVEKEKILVNLHLRSISKNMATR